jgi:hypothetical protein
MLSLAIFSTISNLIFLIIGQIFLIKNKTAKEEKLTNLCEQSIFGFIITSFFALLINFFSSLNQVVNSVFLLLLIILILIFKYKKIFQNLKIIFIFSTLSGVITFFFICLDNIYRPDGGLYHYPFIKILNNEKIILGISNLYYAYGTNSIIQYTSAIYNNLLFKDNGMTIPLANLFNIIFLYMCTEIIEKIKKRVNFAIIFLSIILIYISYKFARYSEYGNDGPAHLLFFYLVYKIIQIKNKLPIEEYSKLALISVFIFFIKITMFFTLLFPILLFEIKKIRTYFFNIKFLFIILFIFLWFSKNILNTGCIIYPVNFTCFKNLQWFNNKSLKEIEIKKEEIEAWSKGWIDQKAQNKIVSFYEYNRKFNWIKTWSEKNLIKILEILLPFITFLIIILITLKFKGNTLKNNRGFYMSKNIKIACIVPILGFIFWFLNFPTFRFGASYIITLISILFAFLYLKNINRDNYLLLIKSLLIISLIVFSFKQISRIYKEQNNYYYNYPWPKFYSFIDNHKQINEKIFKNGEYIYSYNNLGACMYSDSLCLHIKPAEKINYKKKFNYKIFF